MWRRPIPGRERLPGSQTVSVKALEHSEHAEHAAHGHGGEGHGSTQPALLVAILAALLAICEQQAKHAEIRVEEASIGAADTWAQYQAKSIRATLSRDLALLVTAIPPGTTPESAALVTKVMTQFRTDAEHFEHGEGGKDSIAEKAKALEEKRDHSIEQTHTFDNAAAALELGIVLSTASALTNSRKLLLLALVVGIIGLIVGILGVVKPEIAAI
jgi:hypothetical protein